MKRCLSLLLVIMLLSMSVALGESTKKERIDSLGMAVETSFDYYGEMGFADSSILDVVYHEPFISVLVLQYYPIPYGKLIEMAYSDEYSEEEIADILSGEVIPAILIVTDADIDEAVSKVVNREYLTPKEPTELNKIDQYSYWYVPFEHNGFFESLDSSKEEDLKEIEKYDADIEKICEEFICDILNSEFYTPVDPEAGYVGQKISFESVDLDGNPVSTADLFSANQITMVNMWGTWCPNCLGEMDELAEIHKRLQEKGCGIVGIEFEYDFDKETIEYAKEVLASSGITYPNIRKPEEGADAVMDTIFDYPTTFMVDSEGKILTFPLVGMKLDLYEETVDKLLGR